MDDILLFPTFGVDPEDDLPANTQDRKPLDTQPKKKKKKRKRKSKVVVNTAFCKYDVVREAARDLGWEVDEDEASEAFNVFWTDTSVALQRVMRLRNFQRINHFPSMNIICKKISLSLTLSRVRKLLPQQFKFFPQTWCVPAETNQFKKYYASLHKKKTFIVKPSGGCQGKGIFLTRDPINVIDELQDCVIQEYMSKPFLIEGYKFDMRVYALVNSVTNPLSIFLYNDGLVRLCTEPYQKPSEGNLELTYMHLTNYAINKHNDKFVANSNAEDGTAGSKRDFVFLRRYIQEQGGDPDKLFLGIEDLINKTLIAAQPQLKHVYSACFPQKNDGYNCYEVLGFDVLVDHKLRPILLEVNHSPSWTCDSPLDHRIKFNCIRETMQLLYVRPDDKQREKDRQTADFRSRMDPSKQQPTDGQRVKQQLEEEIERKNKERAEHEEKTMKNFYRIHPTNDPVRTDLYKKCIEIATDSTLTATYTAATKERDKEQAAERERKEREREEKRAKVDAIRQGPPKAKVSKTQSETKKNVDYVRHQEQTERHRRRIQLGPRLSVFQLNSGRGMQSDPLLQNIIVDEDIVAEVRQMLTSPVSETPLMYDISSPADGIREELKTMNAVSLTPPCHSQPQSLTPIPQWSSPSAQFASGAASSVVRCSSLAANSTPLIKPAQDAAKAFVAPGPPGPMFSAVYPTRMPLVPASGVPLTKGRFTKNPRVKWTM